MPELGGWLGQIGANVPYSVRPKPRNASRALTNLIPMAIRIYDVDDIEGFVNMCVEQSGLKIADQNELDELVCEGIALLLHMARNFKPQMDGYDKPGRFSGYCVAFLPKKIFTAYHKLHPEHLQKTVVLENGKKVKRYQYGEAPDSLDQRMERAGGEDIGDGIRIVGDFVS